MHYETSEGKYNLVNKTCALHIALFIILVNIGKAPVKQNSAKLDDICICGTRNSSNIFI